MNLEQEISDSDIVVVLLHRAQYSPTDTAIPR
jgi:hypothetical protein